MSDEINKNSVEYLFGQVITRLDGLEKKGDDNHTEVIATFEKHEAKFEKGDRRIAKLERAKHWVMGGAALGSTGGLVAWWKNLFS